MKQFSVTSIKKADNGDSIVSIINRAGTVTILTSSNLETASVVSMPIYSKQQAESMIDVLTKYLQHLNGQTELL